MFYIQATRKMYSEKLFKSILNAIFKAVFKAFAAWIKNNNRLINNSHIRQNCVAANPLNFKVLRTEQHKKIRKYKQLYNYRTKFNI